MWIPIGLWQYGEAQSYFATGKTVSTSHRIAECKWRRALTLNMTDFCIYWILCPFCMETMVRRLKLLRCVPNRHGYLTFDFIDVFGALVCVDQFNSAFDRREGACETEYRVHLGASQTRRVPPEHRDVCFDLFAPSLVSNCRLASNKKNPHQLLA